MPATSLRIRAFPTLVPDPLDLRGRLPDTARRRMTVENNARKKMNRADRRDVDTRIKFMEGLVRRDPEYVDALQILGDDYTKCGRYTEGLNVDERLSRLQPRDPLVFYNLACSYTLTGQFDRAAAALTRALNLGYRDFSWLAKDPDLLSLRKHPIYRDIKDQIRKLNVKIR
jgi:tetratricopeptide (TPR) repeat protein